MEKSKVKEIRYNYDDKRRLLFSVILHFATDYRF